MSAAADEGTGRHDRKPSVERLGPLPRPLALAVLLVWAALTIAASLGLSASAGIWSGARDGLIPAEHRAISGQPLALIRIDQAALDERSTTATVADTALDPSTILAEAGFAIEEALGDERVPLAPPKTEITRWLDAHALYLLPIEIHERLAERLSNEQMLAEVQGLEARLSSPLFSVSGEQPRRDPLGIHELTDAELGRLGHVAELPGGDEPQVSPSGDLIAATGDRALIALRSDRSPADLLADLEAAVAELPVVVVVIDPRVDEATLAAQLDGGEALVGDGVRVVIAGFAALILILAIGMRRLIPVLALVACLGSILVILMFGLTQIELASGGIELGAVALALMLLGFGCDAALRLPPIGSRGWASTLISAVALVPLLLTPYPLWQRWALIWLLASLLTAAIMRVVLPCLLALVRGDLEWRRPGFRLTPMPVVAVGLCVTLTGGGVWASQQLRYRPGTRLPAVNTEAHALERELVQHFFDPTMIVTAESATAEAEAEHPSPAAAALDAASTDAALLAELVPSEARRVDSPGSFVLARTELQARKQALAQLGLGERMEALELLLVDQGLRAEAFAEFVDGASNIDDLPSAQAALDGPLGPWIAGYLSDPELPGARLRSRVELRGRDGLPSVPITLERLAALPDLRGPAMAAMIDQREFGNRLGVVVLAGLWLCAFLVWLGTGSFTASLAVALVALASECGLLLGLALLDQSVGPHLLPIFAVVGASAAVAGARACRAVNLAQPTVARGLLLAGGCQLGIAVALLSSGQPLWRELGLALALGSTLAAGLGLFATPGLAALFDKLRRRPRPASEAGSR